MDDVCAVDRFEGSEELVDEVLGKKRKVGEGIDRKKRIVT